MTVLAVLLAIILVTILVHEGGHALSAHLCGWRILGLKFHPAGGIGVIVEVGSPASDVWKIALGGLAASAGTALVFWSLSSLSLYFVCGFVLNTMMVLVNGFPFGPTDGAHVLRGFRK